MIAPTPGALTREHLNQPLLAVVHLATQPPGVLQQVVLRPDKVSNLGRLIRLGETLGDEAMGWLAIEHVYVVEWIGTVALSEDGTKGTVTPFPPPSADVVELHGELASKVNDAA